MLARSRLAARVSPRGRQALPTLRRLPGPARTPRRLFGWLALLLACALPLAGCGPQIARPSQPGAEATAQAERLLQSGQYAAAAQAYVGLADKSQGAQAFELRLHAAEAYLQGNQLEPARQLLEALPTKGVQPAETSGREVLLAKLALLEHKPAEAIEQSRALTPENVPQWLQPTLLRTRALAYEAQNQELQAALERMALAPLLTEPAAQKANRNAIWDAVSSLPHEVLKDNAGTPPAIPAGWFRLALIARDYIADPAQMRQQIDLWEKQFPNHPASAEVVPQLLQASAALVFHPRHIALLLPFTGQFAQAAAAIRDGFIAAWYRDAQNPQRPDIRVYNADTANILSVYQQAVTDGADFVVGPLEKDAVDLLAKKGKLPVPTLALNQTTPQPAAAKPAPAADTPPPQGTPPSDSAEASEAEHRLYQFGLIPENEARRVAERAWFDGHARALAITPAGAWGDRVFQAFKKRFEELGGTVLAHQVFPADGEDFSTPVKLLLNIDGSERRAAALRHLLHRKIEFQARRRQDADFVFMAAFPRDARQIPPQLRFYHAGSLPIYATSHVYTGQPNPNADGDLDGVVFGDMPWVLGTDDKDSALEATIRKDWPNNAGLSRLTALGVDAYDIIPALGRLSAQRFARFDGATGTLSMDEDGRIHRHLVFARFVDGKPQLLDERAAAALGGPAPQAAPAQAQPAAPAAAQAQPAAPAQPQPAAPAPAVAAPAAP